MAANKKERIINAAIKEFVRASYEKASTNEIVKEAQISKGSLFNYFNSKKELYIYLIDYGIRIFEELYNQIDMTESDLFKRLEKIGVQKIFIYKESPYIFDFLATLLQEDSIEVKDVIKRKIDVLYEEGMEKVYQNIDYSKFREDVDVEKAIEILNWTMFGFEEKVLDQLDTFKDIGKFGDMYFKEWQAYTELLQYSFYK